MKPNKNHQLNRLGEKLIMNDGNECEIIQYNSRRDITVKFKSGYEKKTQYSTFINRQIKDKYSPTVYGVGIIGDKYPTRQDGKHTLEYNRWHSMLQRGYEEKYNNKHPSYKDVYVSKEFLSYTTFYEWFHSQENLKVLIDNHISFDVDKDILFKGNKVYSVDTCVLVPERVNNLFVKNNANRGEYPIGTSLRDNKYITSQIKNINKTIYSTFNSVEDAWNWYKLEKENIIKNVAIEEYSKGTITKKMLRSHD